MRKHEMEDKLIMVTSDVIDLNEQCMIVMSKLGGGHMEHFYHQFGVLCEQLRAMSEECKCIELELAEDDEECRSCSAEC